VKVKLLPVAADDQLIRHLLLRQLDKVGSTAVHWKNVFKVEFGQLRHDHMS